MYCESFFLFVYCLAALFSCIFYLHSFSPFFLFLYDTQFLSLILYQDFSPSVRFLWLIHINSIVDYQSVLTLLLLYSWDCIWISTKPLPEVLIKD